MCVYTQILDLGLKVGQVLALLLSTSWLTFKDGLELTPRNPAGTDLISTLLNESVRGVTPTPGGWQRARCRSLKVAALAGARVDE